MNYLEKIGVQTFLKKSINFIEKHFKDLISEEIYFIHELETQKNEEIISLQIDLQIQFNLNEKSQEILYVSV